MFVVVVVVVVVVVNLFTNKEIHNTQCLYKEQKQPLGNQPQVGQVSFPTIPQLLPVKSDLFDSTTPKGNKAVYTAKLAARAC